MSKKDATAVSRWLWHKDHAPEGQIQTIDAERLAELKKQGWSNSEKDRLKSMAIVDGPVLEDEGVDTDLAETLEKYIDRIKTLEAEKVELLARVEFLENDASNDVKSIDVDDLTVIKGVGDATAESLAQGGITTFDALANISDEQAKELGVKDAWIEDAIELV